MEGPLPLEIYGVASRNDAYSDVGSWVRRDADEGIMCGCAAHCSLRMSSGFITGKSWTNVLRAYRLITAVLLQDFFQRQDVPGAERVHGGSQRAPGWEALSRLPDQTHSSSLAVTACTERR